MRFDVLPYTMTSCSHSVVEVYKKETALNLKVRFTHRHQALAPPPPPRTLWDPGT